MERRINWSSGCYDEIGAVYEKAESNQIAAAILSELETMALAEAEENCGLFSIRGKQVTREQLLAMDEQGRETVMYHLAGVGLEEFDPSIMEGKITVVLSPHIQRTLGCAVFMLLNAVEKLDGTINALFPQVALELKAPLGGKKGLVKCEMLLMQLYPWLAITESSTDAVASALHTPNASETVRGAAPSGQDGGQTPKKKGFFAKLFGK